MEKTAEKPEYTIGVYITGIVVLLMGLLGLVLGFSLSSLLVILSSLINIILSVLCMTVRRKLTYLALIFWLILTILERLLIEGVFGFGSMIGFVLVFYLIAKYKDIYGGGFKWNYS